MLVESDEESLGRKKEGISAREGRPPLLGGDWLSEYKAIGKRPPRGRAYTYTLSERGRSLCRGFYDEDSGAVSVSTHFEGGSINRKKN